MLKYIPQKHSGEIKLQVIIYKKLSMYYRQISTKPAFHPSFKHGIQVKILVSK